MLRENNLQVADYPTTKGYNSSVESSPLFEVEQVYKSISEGVATTSMQVGKLVNPNSYEWVSPPAGASLLWRVILLPEGDTFGHSRGFTLTPSSYVLPLITQSRTGQSFLSQIVHRAAGRHKYKILGRKFSNTGGQITLNYPICAGENFKLQNNNNYPVFCVLCYEMQGENKG